MVAGPTSVRRAAAGGGERQDWRLRAQCGTSAVGPRARRFRAALVSTMCDNASTIDSYICYYLHLGFTTLYLYVDDPADPIVDLARRYDPAAVVVRVRDAALAREWESLPSWSRLRLYAATEVQARQQLNCEHALRCCRGSADFLLHVDADELLHLPDLCHVDGDGAALERHLARLDALDAMQFTYRNIEAVPEAEECDDALRSVSLFKQHPAELDETRDDVAAALRHWTGGSGAYFRFYSNGKSIVRVCDALVEVASVHEWRLPREAMLRGAGYTNNGSLADSAYVPHQHAARDECGGAVVLHFAVCSFGAFWRKRWAALGYASPNHRFRAVSGGIDQRAHSLALGARAAEARALFSHAVMLAPGDETARQLGARVCMRVRLASAIDAARARHLPAAAPPPAPTAAPAGPAEGAVAALATPEWLGRGCASELACVGGAVRSAALAPMSGDAHAAGLATIAVDEAAAAARAEALRALRLCATSEGREELRRRQLPAASDACAEAFVALYSCLLPRLVRRALQLIPRPRGATFDLAPYWRNDLASRTVHVSTVSALLADGHVALPRLVPDELCDGIAAEARAVLRAAPDAVASSTLAHHSREVWATCDEAPPRAPPVDAAVGAPAELFGASVAVGAAESPMLAGVLRLLRGVACALEEAGELRLAVPRACLVREALGLGSELAELPNSGWPDTGVEVCASLFLEPHGAVHVEAADRSGGAPVDARRGTLLLTLSRAATWRVAPAADNDRAGGRLSVCLHMYSAWQRAAGEHRVLGASEAARAALRAGAPSINQ